MVLSTKSYGYGYDTPCKNFSARKNHVVAVHCWDVVHNDRDAIVCACHKRIGLHWKRGFGLHCVSEIHTQHHTGLMHTHTHTYLPEILLTGML